MHFLQMFEKGVNLNGPGVIHARTEQVMMLRLLTTSRQPRCRHLGQTIGSRNRYLARTSPFRVYEGFTRRGAGSGEAFSGRERSDWTDHDCWQSLRDCQHAASLSDPCASGTRPWILASRSRIVQRRSVWIGVRDFWPWQEKRPRLIWPWQGQSQPNWR